MTFSPAETPIDDATAFLRTWLGPMVSIARDVRRMALLRALAEFAYGLDGIPDVTATDEALVEFACRVGARNDRQPGEQNNIEPLRGMLTRLRETDVGDWQSLSAYALAPREAFRWRQPVAGFGLERFCAHFLSCYVEGYAVDALSPDCGGICGHVGLYALNLNDGYGFVGVLGFQTLTPLHRLDALATMLTIVFSRFPVRKLYIESIAPEAEHLEALPGATCEVVLPQNDYACGRYWDRHVFSIGAVGWREFRANVAAVACHLRDCGRAAS
jgi:hypothetical protein